MTPEDATLENEELSQEARWSYYVSAYTMRDPTEGVPFSQMRMPFLKRNLPAKLEQEEEYNRYHGERERSQNQSLGNIARLWLCHGGGYWHRLRTGEFWRRRSGQEAGAAGDGGYE